MVCVENYVFLWSISNLFLVWIVICNGFFKMVLFCFIFSLSIGSFHKDSRLFRLLDFANMAILVELALGY